MPSGKVHALATCLAAGISGPGLVLIGGQPLTYAAAFMTGCAAGLLITPDLDVRHNTESQRLVRKTGGCLVSALWDGLWWPYAHLIIPSHRHPLSHLPLLGTSIRLGYMAAVPLVLWFVLRLFLPLPVLVLPNPTPFILWATAGLAVVDALHAVMDWFWSGLERVV